MHVKLLLHTRQQPAAAFVIQIQITLLWQIKRVPDVWTHVFICCTAHVQERDTIFCVTNFIESGAAPAHIMSAADTRHFNVTSFVPVNEENITRIRRDTVQTRVVSICSSIIIICIESRVTVFRRSVRKRWNNHIAE